METAPAPQTEIPLEAPPAAPVQPVEAVPAPVAAAPAPAPNIQADPVLRAQVEKVKAEEVARLRTEAEATRKQDLEALEAKLRAEAEQKTVATAAEQQRLAELTENEHLLEQNKALALKDAEREVRLEEANRKVKEADEKLDFVRAIVGAGRSLAKQDPALEDLAHNKAKALVSGGLSLDAAIAKLAEEDSYLFAKPVAAAVVATSTAAGSSAPRGSVNPTRAPSQGADTDAFKMTPEQWANAQSDRAIMAQVSEVAH